MVLILFVGMFVRCASIMTPEGGPIDTLPPVVMVMTPENFTTNFSEKKIFIEFDEFVQLKDQQKEFFVSPMMTRKPLLSIRGRGVLVTMRDDTLHENTTYALNFGSTIVDNNEGNPLHSFRYVFSTGDKIDSMIISGYTVDAYGADSVSKSFIYFYPVDSLEIGEGYDSTLFKRQPAVIGRAENNGIFITQNLKPIDYKVYAFEDTNSNQTYEAATDKVGFLDSLYNPTRMPDFGIWYDSIRQYVVADPQLYMRLFTDVSFSRQILQESKRPTQYKAELYFGAAFPEIISIELDSIPSENIILEPLTVGRDTLNMWFDLPAELIPDSIRGTITYMKHDSLRVLGEVSEPLKLNWRFVETKAEREAREDLDKERERALKRGEEWIEPEVPNPFKMNLTKGGDINPEHSLVREFDFPLSTLDTAAITMVSYPASSSSGESITYTPEPITITRDTMSLRRYFINSAWSKQDAKYLLNIPQGAITNIAQQSNDSLSSEYSLYNPEKYAVVIVNIKGRDGVSAPNYIVELLNSKNVLIESKMTGQSDKIQFNYVRAGDIRLRVIEDSNNNGKWDSGNLIEMRHPERVELYSDGGEDIFTTRENWDMELDMDIGKLFAPITMESVMQTLEEQEIKRLERLEESRAEAKRKAEEKKNSSSGGFGMSSITGAVSNF